jgi:prepilin-type N-terminal cleavage/methylation domain-containing protein
MTSIMMKKTAQTPSPVAQSTGPARKNCRNRERRLQRGMSLVESMISLAILGFGVLGAAATQITAVKLAQESRLRTEAYYLAEQKMEEFRAMDGDAVTDAFNDTDYPNDSNNPLDPDPNDSQPRQFNRSWTITADSPEAGIFTIVVEVQWTGKLGATRTVSIESIKTDI